MFIKLIRCAGLALLLAGLFAVGFGISSLASSPPLPLLSLPAPHPAFRPARPVAPACERCMIGGDTKVPRDSLVRLSADKADPKAGLIWRVSPSKGVSRATNPRGIFEFVAPPGTYEVDLLAVTVIEGGQVDVRESQTVVTIGESTPPPDVKPPVPPAPKANALQALCRLRVGNAGCTATVIYPRRADGRWDIATASHCTGGVGTRGEVTLKDGRKLAVTITVHAKQPDLCWLVTDDATLADLPYAVMAAQEPEPGTAVWHAGYGVDQPGNREDGTVSASPDSNSQIRFNLSVSSGDSGGGIFRTDTNEWLSAVCCTASMARKGSMWGGSTMTAAKLRPKPTGEIDTTEPTPIPVRPEEKR